MAERASLEEVKRIEAFQGIREESLERIRVISRKRTVKKGGLLFLEKDQVDHFYGVLSGKAALYRISSEGQKRVFFILGEGSLLNEVVFDAMPVSVACEAFEKLEVLELPKDGFLAIMEQDFPLTMHILNSIGRKQRRLYRQLKNTLPIGMEKKLAAKLWKLSKDYGVPGAEAGSMGEPWKSIDMNLSCTYLSYMLGVSRESISRAMKTLQDMGACRWEDRILQVKEMQLLDYYRSRE